MDNERITSGLLSETQQLAESIDYASPLSEQLLILLGKAQEEDGLRLINTLLDDEKKLGQLDASSKGLMRSLINEHATISYSEVRALLFTLLSRPSPTEQRRAIEANKDFLDREKSSQIKEDLSVYLQLKYALDHAEATEAWEDIFSFYKALTPEEQKASGHHLRAAAERMTASITKRTLRAIPLLSSMERTEVGCDLRRIMETAIKADWMIELLGMLSGLSSEERQSLRPRLDTVIDHAAKNGYRECVIEVLGSMSPQERLENSKSVLSAVEEVYKRNGIPWLLMFYGMIASEERGQLRQYIETALSIGEAKREWEVLLNYYGKLKEDERELLEKRIDKAILGAEKHERGGIGMTKYYLSLPKDDRFYLIDNLKAALRNTPRNISYPYGQMEGIFNSLGCFTEEEKEELREEIDDIVDVFQKEFQQATKRQTPKRYGLDGLTIDRDEMAITSVGECLLRYYGHLSPEERKERKGEIEVVIIEMEKNEDWSEILTYYSVLSAEEKSENNSHMQKALNRLLVRENTHEVLEYYSHRPQEDRRIIPEAISIGSRFLTTLKSNVGDVGLRANYCGLLAQRLQNPEGSLVAMQTLIPRDKLSLVTGLECLGVEALPVLSWKLNEENIQVLLAVVARLVNNQKGSLLEGLILPFRPRGRESAGFEDRLIDWLRHLDFLAGLGPLLGSDVSLTNHLSNLRELQTQAGVTTTATELSAGFIKEVLREIEGLEETTLEQFRQLFQIEGLTFADVQRFIESWNGEIESLIVLSQRFSQKEQDVMKCLTRTIGAAVRGTYVQERYNVDNRLTQKQLAPLTRRASSPEAVLEAYHEGVYQVHTIEQGETQSSSGGFEVPEHVSQRLKENLMVHNHLDELFTVSGLDQLPTGARNSLRLYLSGLLMLTDEATMKTPNQLKEFCQEQRVPVEFQGAFIRIRQFMQDLFSGQKTAVRLKQSLEKLLEALPPSLQQLSVFASDLGEFLSGELVANASTKGQRVRQKRLLIHTTDHPKTLLEIGKYPLNSGSCQSYDYSDQSLMRSLPGYVSDAHIQAIVVRELDEGMDDADEVMTVDEGKRVVTVRNNAGSEKKIKMSRPKARSMIFVGDKNSEGVLFRQVSYQEPGQIDPDLADKLEDEVLVRFVNKLKLHNPSLSVANKDEREIDVSGSHNVGGHYNDLLGGQAGQAGRNYTI